MHLKRSSAGSGAIAGRGTAKNRANFGTFHELRALSVRMVFCGFSPGQSPTIESSCSGAVGNTAVHWLGDRAFRSVVDSVVDSEGGGRGSDQVHRRRPIRLLGAATEQIKVAGCQNRAGGDRTIGRHDPDGKVDPFVIFFQKLRSANGQQIL